MKSGVVSKSVLTNPWLIGSICLIIGITFVSGIIILLDTITRAAWENKFDTISFTKSIIFLFCCYLFLALLIYPTSRPKTSIKNTIISLTGIIWTLAIIIIISAIVVIMGVNGVVLEYYSIPRDVESYSIMEAAFFGTLSGLIIFIPTLLVTRYLLGQAVKQVEVFKSKEVAPLPPPPPSWKQPSSFSGRVRALFQVYYGCIGIISIALVVSGIVGLWISQTFAVAVFGAMQFVLGIVVMVLSAILLRKRYEGIPAA